MGHIYLAVDRPKHRVPAMRLQIDNVNNQCYDSMLEPTSLRSIEAHAMNFDHRHLAKKYGSMGFMTVTPEIKESPFHEFLSFRAERTDFIGHLKFGSVRLILTPDISLRPVVRDHYTGRTTDRENTITFYQYNLGNNQHQIVELSTYCKDLTFMALEKGESETPGIDADHWRRLYERGGMEVELASNVEESIDPTEQFKQMFAFAPNQLSFDQAELIAKYKSTLTL